MSKPVSWLWGAVGTLTLLALLSTACRSSESEEDTPPSTNTSAEESATSLEEPGTPVERDDQADRPPVAEPVWTACEAGLECGTVNVPLDYDNPDGTKLDIALIRRRATGDSPVKGSIFVNPGGPGASGVDFVRNGFQLDPDTTADYHLVGFDPRGIGQSQPLDCGVNRSLEPLLDLSPDSEAEQQQLNDEAQTLVDHCIATDVSRLGFLTTVNVARDLDRLRQAVGDTALNYYGFSYGTLLAIRYVELFPDHAGRLVLDGVVDPTRDLTGLLSQQALAFEAGFTALEARCQSDGPCPPDGLEATFDRVFRQLEASGPINDVGSTELVMASLLPVYNPAIWPQYRQALIEADEGDVAGVGGLSNVLTNSISFTAYAAFACADTEQPDGTAAWQSFAADLAEKAPRFGAVVANELRVCSLWPVTETEANSDDTLTDAASRAPHVGVLIIGTDGDAATPIANAISVGEQLPGSHLVSVRGQRHTAYNGSGCVRQIVADFFADELALPGSSFCIID